MFALRLRAFVAAVVLASAVPVAAQEPPPMSRGLLNDVRDIEVQKQLIALGVLDATAGQASTNDLGAAVAWFRRAYKSAEGVKPLTADEKSKLKQAYEKFKARTRLEMVTYSDATTKTQIKLRVPVEFTESTPKKSVGKNASEWWEYRGADNKVSIGPEIHLLSNYTPIALFRERIMSAALTYTHLHLTSEEFAVQGNAGSEAEGFHSSNLVLTSKDKLKGVFMRYAKAPPASFQVPDFLDPVVATESGGPKGDPATRSWQLLMQGVSNLAVSEFPIDNGWQAVSTGPCPYMLEGPDGSKTRRILFGTDRKAKPAAQQKSGPVADPDSLFANEPGNQLHLGCAYVTLAPPPKEVDKARDLAKSTIPEYRWLFSTDKANNGDELYLRDELADRHRQTRSRAVAGQRAMIKRSARSGRDPGLSSALVFIHGYNVSFKDALFTVAQIVDATGYPGRVYMYSWPSAVSTFGYIGDLDNSEQAEPFLQSFMKLLMRDADIDEIDILVHSMGSQSVLRALSALRSVFETERQGDARERAIRIGQVIFAAPDVAMPVFDQKVRRIAPYASRVTVYASSTDAALLASKFLRSGASRTGELKDDGQPVLVEARNVHVIDATITSGSWWRLDRVFGYGHDYFRQSPAVLGDIKLILESIGRDDETKTPKQRSPDLYEEKAFKEAEPRAEPWYYWKLKDLKANK